MATVEKRGDSYKITVSCGYRLDGTQVRRNMTWIPTPGMTERQSAKELERQRVLFEERCKSISFADGSIKFEAFADQWFAEHAKPNLKIRTVERYEQLKPRVYAAFGHLRMDKITRRMIQLFVANLGENEINLKTHGKLSPKTIKNYLSFVSSIFNYAVVQGVVENNPCRGVVPPPAAPIERSCYTLEEAQHFLELLEQEPLHWKVFFTLAIYGGFRRGELCGFEWKDIDFDNTVITVNRTSLYTKENGVFTDTPKTKGSQRCLKLPCSVLTLLAQYREVQASLRLAVGDQWIDSDRLFVAWNGKPINPNSAQGWLHEFLERAEMRQVGIHSFRHLNASLLISGGADVKTVSSALGHAQVSTTLNIYAHSFAAAQARASEAVANALDFSKKKDSTAE